MIKQCFYKTWSETVLEKRFGTQRKTLKKWLKGRNTLENVEIVEPIINIKVEKVISEEEDDDNEDNEEEEEEELVEEETVPRIHRKAAIRADKRIIAIGKASTRKQKQKAKNPETSDEDDKLTKISTVVLGSQTMKSDSNKAAYLFMLRY